MTPRRPIALDLPVDEHEPLGILAIRLGARGKSDLCRRLARWSVAYSQTPGGIQRLKEILGLAPAENGKPSG